MTLCSFNLCRIRRQMRSIFESPINKAQGEDRQINSPQSAMSAPGSSGIIQGQQAPASPAATQSSNDDELFVPLGRASATFQADTTTALPHSSPGVSNTLASQASQHSVANTNSSQVPVDTREEGGVRQEKPTDLSRTSDTVLTCCDSALNGNLACYTCPYCYTCVCLASLEKHS